MSQRHLILESQDFVMLVWLMEELAKTFPASSYEIAFGPNKRTNARFIYATVEPEKSVSVEAIQCAAQVASNIYKRAISYQIAQNKALRDLR